LPAELRHNVHRSPFGLMWSSLMPIDVTVISFRG
jgi:hypothetical protein